MARIRTVKPEFFRHEELYEAEKAEQLPLRLAFAGLWTACCREGRFKWKPKTLKLDCLPHDEIDFSRVLDALWTRGFIEKYTFDGEIYGFIPSWSEHQSINNKEAESNLPEPTESSLLTRDARVDDAKASPLESPSGEGKGKERKGKGIRVKRVSDEITFLEWMNTVPDGGDAIPKDHGVFAYAKKVNLPDGYLDLAWIKFEKRYAPDKKKYKNWPQHFQNYVEAGWGGLWAISQEGEYYLTTAGKQLSLEVNA